MKTPFLSAERSPSEASTRATGSPKKASELGTPPASAERRKQRCCRTECLISAVALGLLLILGIAGQCFETFWPRDTNSEVASLVQTSCSDAPGCAEVERWAVKADLPFRTDFVFGGPCIDVDSELIGPEIVGFGGAFTEATAVIYSRLRSQKKQQVMEDYFGKQGLGYTLGRVHINSCDFSLKSYSFDDVENDTDLVHFDTSVAHDRRQLIPMIRDASEKVASIGEELRLFASPWSPPAWMKGNREMTHSSRPCLRPEARASWAAYFVKWISAYKAQGVPIWGVTVQNEPLNDSEWEACVYTSAELADFIADHLGPRLRAAHPEVKIFTYDHNKDHIYEWTNATYSHHSAANFVDGVAFHWYAGDGFDNLQRVHADFPHAMLLATEATYERTFFPSQFSVAKGAWNMGEGYAHDMMGDLNAGSVGWTDWNLILDQDGGPNHLNNTCDAAIIADMAIGELHRHPQYYYIGHFSKFILPGARLMKVNIESSQKTASKSRPYGTCTSEDGLEATAFLRKDGRIAVVVLNCGDESIRYKLRYKVRALEGLIPAHGIQTYLFGSHLHRERIDV